MDSALDPVECYSGGEYPERPRALDWHGVRLEIAEVLQSWRTPDGKHFMVCLADGQVFELTYKEQADAWNITPKQVVAPTQTSQILETCEVWRFHKSKG